MCDIVFEKAKGRGGTVSRTSVYGEAAMQRFFKKDTLRNFTKLTRKHMCQNLFFVFSCQFCGICENTFFAEQYRSTDSDYSSIISSEGSIGKRNCKL